MLVSILVLFSGWMTMGQAYQEEPIEFPLLMPDVLPTQVSNKLSHTNTRHQHMALRLIVLNHPTLTE